MNTMTAVTIDTLDASTDIKSCIDAEEPFEPTEELLAAIEEAIQIENDPNAKFYTSAKRAVCRLARIIYDVNYTTRFFKSYKRALKRGLPQSEIDDVIEKLRTGKYLEAKFKDHALAGECRGMRECHIRPDWFLVYKKIETKLLLILIDTGSHSYLFKK